MDNSKIPQLRINLTEKCDKKCFYCRPAGEAISSLDNNIEAISYDKLIFLVRQLVEGGISIIRLTGGEPMLYPNIFKLIKDIKSINGVKEVSLVTRSRNLKKEANNLKKVGLDSITVSIDSLDRNVLKRITGVDILEDLLIGVKECAKLKIPLKINTVIMKDINDSKESIMKFIDFIKSHKPITWKILDYMLLPNQDSIFNTKSLFVNLNEIKQYFTEQKIQERFEFSTQAGGLGSPMATLEISDGVVIQIKDSTIGSHYSDECKTCNFFPCQDAIMALRLTIDGKLQRCLYRGDNLLNLKPHINNDITKLKDLIQTALNTYKNSIFEPRVWDIKKTI